MSKKKVFITGGTGFVGYHLIKRLCQDDWHVRCLARPTSRRSALMSFDVEFIEGDICNLNSLKQGVQDVDAVVHLAGLTRSLRRNDFMEINRDGCRNISL
ncbi:MAG: NAD-dependent epimerase/dehydratase family protein, partial [Thermoguttaceae bacterium]|nr:NAD-dependent epimerase/dehydratase family protein [Thermoguttaceae bacterium]